MLYSSTCIIDYTPFLFFMIISSISVHSFSFACLDPKCIRNLFILVLSVKMDLIFFPCGCTVVPDSFSEMSLDHRTVLLTALEVAHPDYRLDASPLNFLPKREKPTLLS